MVRITRPRNPADGVGANAGTDAAPVSSPARPATTAATPSNTTAPTTRAADRARLAPGAAPAGGSGAVDLRAGVDPALLAPYRPKIRKALEALALSAPSPMLTAALTALAQHPQAEALAVMAMSGRTKAAKVTEDVLSQFNGLSIPRENAIGTLVGRFRAEAVTAALAGHHGDLVRLLRPALEDEPDPERVRHALAVITTAAESPSGSFRLASRLTDAGCFSPGDWRSQELTGDPIGALVELGPLAADGEYDRPTRSAAVEAHMAERGLFASPKWTSTRDLSTHRGVLGEALRIADVEPLLTSPAQRVVQGVLVLESPPAMWNAPDAETAKAWAQAHGRRTDGIHRHKDEHGKSHWGFLLTELDVSVFEKLPDGRERPLRFENVKAGPGSAGKAASQNTIAREGLANPDMRYLFPDGDRFREPALDRSQAVQDALIAVTVGPADDPRYDVALPLTGHDLTAMAMRRDP